MNTSNPDQNDDPTRELEEADWLLEKADALLRRHTGEPSEGDDEGLPLLTEIIDEFAPPSADGSARASLEADSTALLAERLVGLDALLTREIENWFATELPALVEQELASCTRRIQEEALARMRSTLVPRLSEELASRLGEAQPSASQSHTAPFKPR